MNAASHSSRFRLALGAVVTAALLVPLAVYGAPAIAKSVQICHRTHSKKHPWHLITVSSKAVKAHLRHGDTVPPCSTQPAAKKHGKGHGHDVGDRGESGTKHGKR